MRRLLTIASLALLAVLAGRAASTTIADWLDQIGADPTEDEDD